MQQKKAAEDAEKATILPLE